MQTDVTEGPTPHSTTIGWVYNSGIAIIINLTVIFIVNMQENKIIDEQ